jgi:hypothetical protein
VDLAEMRVEGGRNLETIQNFKIYPIFFLKNKKYTLAVIVNGDKGFFAKKKHSDG